MNVGFAPGVGGTSNDGAAESVVFKQCVSELRQEHWQYCRKRLTLFRAHEQNTVQRLDAALTIQILERVGPFVRCSPPELRVLGRR